MEIVLVLSGIIIGFTIAWIRRGRERIHGIIHVDHETEQCVFNLQSDQLVNRKNKIAVFVINHNAKLSREEQTL